MPPKPIWPVFFKVSEDESAAGSSGRESPHFFLQNFLAGAFSRKRRKKVLKMRFFLGELPWNRGAKARILALLRACWARASRPPEVRCVFFKDSGSLATAVQPSGASRWRAVVRVLRSPLDALGCTLIPSPCALCGVPLPRLSLAPVCDACWAEFQVSTDVVCERCGDLLDPSARIYGGTVCRACRLVPPPFVRAVSYAPYRNRMCAAIHALKYDGLYPVARGLGALLAQALEPLAEEAPRRMLVVPIPLHRTKLALRGFNQARALSTEAIKVLRRSHPEWRLKLASSTLMRLRPTVAQAGLSPRERRKNVRGAFSVTDAAPIADQHILLVDDILTTGATARAASKVLIDAGAASVWVATLARARHVRDTVDDHDSRQKNVAALDGRGDFSDSLQDQRSF